ncbi:hypothetical protein ACFL0M_04000 [Thermodesulfobacteriota bacterium]
MITPGDIKGILATIATPFKEKKDLAVGGLKILTRYLLSGGVDGIMA